MIRLVYVANIVVAGWIAVTTLFFPGRSMAIVFSGVYDHTEVVRLVGALWLSIALLSILGLWKPLTFSPVLLIQLIYKGSWLVVVAVPAMLSGAPYPKGMAAFFLAWVAILPFAIPWKQWILSP